MFNSCDRLVRRKCKLRSNADSLFRSSASDGNWLFTGPASLRPIVLHAGLAGSDPCCIELFGDVAAGCEVHFIRSLAHECRVRQVAVVLLDLEGHEFSDGGDGVQRVQIEGEENER